MGDDYTLKQKLMAAKSIEEVKAILSETGGYSGDEVEHIWKEIEQHRSDKKEKLDLDELDAVSGGYQTRPRNWYADGCAATCEDGSWCSSNDFCYSFDVQYEEFHLVCSNGQRHDWEYKGQKWDKSSSVYMYNYICRRCGKELNNKVALKIWE